MRTNIFKIIFTNKKILAGVIFSFIGLIMIFLFLFKDKVKTISDLRQINATVNDFSFKEFRGLKNSTTYNYFLNLNEYRNDFRISADFIDLFSKDQFEQNIKSGDSIQVLVPQKELTRINKKDEIHLFGVFDKNYTYLDYDSSIQKYNSKFMLYGGLIFIFIGLFLLYIEKEKFHVNTIPSINPGDHIQCNRFL